MALSKQEKRIARIWQYFDKYGKFPFEHQKEIIQAEKDFDELFAESDAIPEC